MKNLLKTTIQIGFTEFSLVLVALIRNKYLAHTIGPAGFGQYGLLNSFFTLISLFSTAWLLTGLTKLTAEHNNEATSNLVEEILSTTIILSFILNVVIALVLITRINFTLVTFLSKEISAITFIIFILYYFFLNIVSIYYAYLQGLKKVKNVIYLRIFSSLFEIISIIILVYYYGLKGFFISLAISSFLQFVIMLIINDFNLKPFLTVIQNKGLFLKRILQFGFANLLVGLVYLLSQYLLRVITIQNLDLNSVGILTAALSMMGYLGITDKASSYIFLPKMSEILDDDSRNEEVNSYLRFTILVNIPIILFSILFGNIIIRLLFSSRFESLSYFFYWFVIAQFLNSIAHAFHYNIVGLGYLKTFSMIGILGNTIIVLFAFIFIKQLNVGAIGIGFVINYLVTITVFILFFNYKNNFNLTTVVKKLLLFSLCCIIISVYFIQYVFPIRIVVLLVILLPFVFMISKHEYKMFLTITKNRFIKKAYS
jgi:polysaccharide transporter, PST family